MKGGVRSYLWSQSVCCVAAGSLFFATETAGRWYQSFLLQWRSKMEDIKLCSFPWVSEARPGFNTTTSSSDQTLDAHIFIAAQIVFHIIAEKIYLKYFVSVIQVIAVKKCWRQLDFSFPSISCSCCFGLTVGFFPLIRRPSVNLKLNLLRHLVETALRHQCL